MTKKVFFSLLAMVAIFSFSNIVYAENFNKTLKDSSWMLTMKKTGKHSLAEFKGGYQYLNGERSLAYTVSGSVFKIKSKKGSATFKLYRNGESLIAKNRRNIVAFSMKKAPKGYADFVVIRAEENPAKKLSLAKKLSIKGLDPFVASQVADILFDGNEFVSAAKVYAQLNDQTGTAACNIMQIATTGKIPKGVDIASAAKIFWEHNASTHSSLGEFYYRAEAIAYACAAAGNLERAGEYQKALYQQAQRYSITKASEMRAAKVSVSKIGQVLLQYQNGKCPGSFNVSAI